jgi:chromosome segregation ATPase
MLNNQINSLELRKNNATKFLDLLADLKELDSSIKMVKRSLAQNDVDTASHFLGKS